MLDIATIKEQITRIHSTTQEDVCGILERTFSKAIIPKRIVGTTRDDLIKLGFKFGEGGDRFVNVELPPGWTKRRIQSFQSELLDSEGKKRADIFDIPPPFMVLIE